MSLVTVIVTVKGVLLEEAVKALALHAGALGRLGNVSVELAHERSEVLAREAFAHLIDCVAIRNRRECSRR